MTHRPAANRRFIAFILCVVAMSLTGLPQAASAQSLYWIDSLGGRIIRANIDGSDEVTLISGLNQPALLAVDAGGGHLYYRVGQYDIYRAGLDGSNPSPVFESTDGSILAMEPNEADGMLYFFRAAPHYAVFRMFPDGSGVEEFVDVLDAGMFRDVWGIDFNFATGEMYTSTFSGRDGWIYAMPMDNPTNFRQLYSGDDVRCIDIRVDSMTQKMYWVDTYRDAVYAANADGSNPEALAYVDTVSTLEYDPQTQKLYRDDQFFPWGIYRMDTDGTNDELVLDNGARVSSLRLARPSCMSLDVSDLVEGEIATITVSHDPAVGPIEVAVVYSLTTGSFYAEYIDGWCVDLGIDLGTRPLNRVVCYGTTTGGQLSCDIRVPRGTAGFEVHMQAAMRLTCPGVCQSPVVSTTVIE